MRHLPCLLLALLLPSSLLAFDGSKQGFLLGAGIGPCHASVEETYEGYSDNYSVDRVGIGSDFVIGYGFTPNFALMYENVDSWYQVHGDIFYDAVGPVGIRYYLNGDSTGPVVGANAFIGSFVNETKNAGMSGNGFGIVVGYEFARHVSVEARYQRFWGTEDGLKHTSNALQLMLMGIAY